MFYLNSKSKNKQRLAISVSTAQNLSKRFLRFFMDSNHLNIGLQTHIIKKLIPTKLVKNHSKPIWNNQTVFILSDCLLTCR